MEGGDGGEEKKISLWRAKRREGCYRAIAYRRQQSEEGNGWQIVEIQGRSYRRRSVSMSFVSVRFASGLPSELQYVKVP